MFHLPGRKSSGISSGRRNQGKSGSSAEAGKGKGKGEKIAQLPDLLSKKQGRTRACMICSLIKTEMEFEDEGCDNCEDFLQLSGQKGSVLSYTSANFEGMIAMISPEDSWVAKWQRIVHLKPGAYAINVRGEVENWIRSELKDAGKQLIPRDRSMSSKALKKPEKPREKRRSRRVSADSTDDGAGDEENDAPSVPEVAASSVAEETGETEETCEGGEEEGGQGNDKEVTEEPEETQEAPSCSGATIKIKMEASDTASVVSGNMTYRGGRRYSDSSDSSSGASDDENENQD